MIVVAAADTSSLFAEICNNSMSEMSDCAAPQHAFASGSDYFGIIPGPDVDCDTNTFRVTILVVLGVCLLRVVIQMILDMREKIHRSEVIPGFPSCPEAHWLVGHAMVLRGLTEESFVRGYERVFFEHADPETAMSSLWFFNMPAISVMKGKDAKKVLLSSSFRKQAWLISRHTRQFLGSKTLLVLMKKEWRHYRNAIHKSFTTEVIRQSRPYIYRVGNELADALQARVEVKHEQQKEKNEETSLSVSPEEESISDDDDFGAAGFATKNIIKPSSPSTEDDDEAGIVVSVLALMRMATIDVFGLVALRSNGVDFGCARDLKMSRIASAIDHLTTEYTRRLETPWNPLSCFYEIPTKANRKYRAKKTVIRDFVAEQITKTRARIRTNNHETDGGGSNNNDLLTNLVIAADSEKAKLPDSWNLFGDGKAHDRALGDVLLTLVFGGYDTTSISLSYALYLLAKNPTKLAKCRAEVDAVLGSDCSSVDNDVCMTGQMTLPGKDELPYTMAVMMESLRLFPPAPLTFRTMEKKTTIGGDENGSRSVTLPKGQYVMIPIWSIQRSELNYPRPYDMIPERWVRERQRRATDSNADCNDGPSRSRRSTWEVRPENDEYHIRSNKQGRPPDVGPHDNDHEDDFIAPANRDAFCVFSAGARNCVGKNLAIEESVILLACLVHKMSFQLMSDSYEVSPSIHALLQLPEDGLPMIVRPRRINNHLDDE